MPDLPIEVIREARRALSDWLDQARLCPDPASLPPQTMRSIGSHLGRAGVAMREARPSVVASEAWEKEIAGYMETLRELRARLGNFEITLRIRRYQMIAACSRMDAVRSWSDLARHIG